MTTVANEPKLQALAQAAGLILDQLPDDVKDNPTVVEDVAMAVTCVLNDWGPYVDTDDGGVLRLIAKARGLDHWDFEGVS